MSKISVLVYKPTTKTSKKVDKLKPKFDLIISTEEQVTSEQLVVAFGVQGQVLPTEVDILILKGDTLNVDEFIQNSKPRYKKKKLKKLSGLSNYHLFLQP